MGREKEKGSPQGPLPGPGSLPPRHGAANCGTGWHHGTARHGKACRGTAWQGALAEQARHGAARHMRAILKKKRGVKRSYLIMEDNVWTLNAVFCTKGKSLARIQRGQIDYN